MRCLLRRYSFSPLRNSRRPSSRTWKSTGSSPSPLSRTRVTSAMPCAERFSDPAQITSSALRERSARPCSPSAQRSASARLDLPEPLGPDDRRDARTELDVRALGERLEALQTQGEQPRRGQPGLAWVRSCAVPVRGSAGPIAALGPDGLDRLGRRGRLRLATRQALAAADDPPVDPDLDLERLLVIGTGRLEQAVLRSRAPCVAGCTPGDGSWDS